MERSFNRNGFVSDVVDGLVVVDLAGLTPAVLEKYLGARALRGSARRMGSKKTSL
jgi:hypothetical protein